MCVQVIYAQESCDIDMFSHSGLTVVIVLDLSKPDELWSTLEVLLKQVRIVFITI